MTQDQTPDRARITITSEIAEIPKVVTAVEDFAAKHQLSDELLHAVTLSLDEVITNIASYAYPSGTTGPVVVELSKQSGWMEIRVKDSGAPFNPLIDAKEPDLDSPLESREIGGLGIHFVKTLMDEVSYDFLAGENQLLMRKSF
ncbi:ATP-binding protein [Rhodovibrionaceae bacterium A322]